MFAESNAKSVCGLELNTNKIAINTLGVDIMMVCRRCATRFQQFPYGKQRRIIYRLFIKVFPNFIKIDEPIEKLGILDLREVAGEGLIKMVMGVDKTGDHHVGGTIYNPVCLIGEVGADLFNPVVPD
jgi:hypothetical protein